MVGSGETWRRLMGLRGAEVRPKRGISTGL